MTLPLHHTASQKWPSRACSRTLRRHSIVYGSLAFLAVGILCTTLVVSTWTRTEASAPPAKRGLDSEEVVSREAKV